MASWTAKLKNTKLPSAFEIYIYISGSERKYPYIVSMQTQKRVSILSLWHESEKITNSAKKNPQTIQYYNQTKCGVAIADPTTKTYLLKASSRLWPVQVLYNNIGDNINH